MKENNSKNYCFIINHHHHNHKRVIIQAHIINFIRHVGERVTRTAQHIELKNATGLNVNTYVLLKTCTEPGANRLMVMDLINVNIEMKYFCAVLDFV